MANNTSSNDSLSAYAQYCLDKDIKILGTSLHSQLFDLTQDAARKVKKTHAAWVRDVLTQAVLDAGFEYTPPTKENLQQQLARMQREMKERDEEIARLKAAIVPTPPPVQANAQTGKIEQK